jgi:hypothetical protein
MILDLENKYGLNSNVFRESGVFMEMKFKASKIMKKIAILFFTILAIISCKSIEISPTDIIGKWQPQYLIPYNFNDNTWGKAILVDSLSNNYVLEFTDEGEFLINGKSGGSCCSAGDKYSISGNEINFSELSLRGCQNVFCANCSKWNIEKVNNETLILEECGKRKIQYVKTK